MNSRVLETGIGVVFVWLSASLIVSGLVEAIASAFHFRAKDLANELSGWLTPTAPAAAPAAAAPAEPAAVVPVAAPAVAFAEALKTNATTPPGGTASASLLKPAHPTLGGAKFKLKKMDPKAFAASIVEEWETLQSSRLGQFLQKLVPITNPASPEFGKIRGEAEQWFNARMALVSAAYQKRARYIAIGLGLLVAIVLGLDSFGVAARIYNNQTLRDSLVSQSVKLSDLPTKGCATATPTTTAPRPDIEAETQCIKDISTKLTDLKLTTAPLDPREDGFLKNRQSHWWGILLTAAAIGAGAPFWFQILKKLLGLRPPKAA